MQTKSNDDTEVSDTGVCKLEPAENRHRNCLYAGRGKISLNCFTRKWSIHTDLVWVESHMKIFSPLFLSYIHTLMHTVMSYILILKALLSHQSQNAQLNSER